MFTYLSFFIWKKFSVINLIHLFLHSVMNLQYISVICIFLPVPSRGHCGFPSFQVVDWFCLFVDLWVFTFPLEDCSVFVNFVIILLHFCFHLQKCSDMEKNMNFLNCKYQFPYTCFLTGWVNKSRSNAKMYTAWFWLDK